MDKIRAPQPTAASAPVQRLEALTGIRMIAALAIFATHEPPPASAPAVLRGFAEAGHEWMTMFFILSGLILTWNYDELLQNGVTGRGLRAFYVARFARIYPLYLLGLLLVVVPQLAAGSKVTAILSNGAFWLHVFALQPWSGNLAVAFGYNTPAWSIGVEFFLYALFPFLLLAFARIRNRPVVLLAIGIGALVVMVGLTLVLTPPWAAHVSHAQLSEARRWLYRMPLTRLPDFALGISLTYLIKLLARNRQQTDRRHEAWGLAAQVVGGFLAVGIMLLPGVAYSTWSLGAINMIPFALLLLGLVWAPQTLLARFLAGRPMVLLGEISLEFYLLHWTIVQLVGVSGNGYLGWITHWLTAFVLTVLLAGGAHFVIGRPLRVLLRRWLDPSRRVVIP